MHAMIAIAAKRAPLAERRDDFYETPDCATRALMHVETLPHCIWEPACGHGAISRVLESTGRKVYSTDLISRGYGLGGIDFLITWPGMAPLGYEAIVTNPPYKLAAEFVEHALDLCPRVYMLLRLAFLESERRTALLESGWLRRVYVFRKRLPRMHREGWTGPRASSAVAFAWFCWDRNNPGATELLRISHEEP
jgi:hypothetical protein